MKIANLKEAMKRCRIRPHTQYRILVALCAVEQEERMKTLDEHNKEKMEEYGLEPPTWTLIPIACDGCGKEIRAQTAVILTSHPPKQKVSCSNPQCDEYNKVKYMVI